MTAIHSSATQEPSYPFLDTRAALMLRSALDEHKRRNRVSLRNLSKQLGYKQSAILSHMANGRVAIPLDRAEELAEVLGLSKPLFLEAVIRQRHAVFAEALHALYASNDALDDGGIDWTSLNESQLAVIREVARDRYPQERWLTPHEVPVFKILRDAAPEIASKGLTKIQTAQIAAIFEPTG